MIATLASLLLLALAQEQTSCKPCAGSGREICSRHPKDDLSVEARVEYCSVIADCATCGGAGFVTCRKCRGNPRTEARLAQRRALVLQRRGELTFIDEGMGRPVRKVCSADWILVWEIDSMKVEKRVLNAHQLLHLYLDRLDWLKQEYLAVLGAKATDFTVTPQVFVWWLEPDQLKASTRFCGQGAPSGVKLMGSRSAYSVCGGKRNFNMEDQLGRNVIHCGAHLLLNHQSPSNWIGNHKAGWADEGLAHWFEDRFGKLCDNFCFEEVYTNAGFRAGNFRVMARKLVESDKAPSLAVLFDKNSDALNHGEHVAAFSVVDYLLAQDAAKFNALLADLRRQRASRDALETHFGFNVLRLEGLWRTWVLATYPRE